MLSLGDIVINAKGNRSKIFEKDKIRDGERNIFIYKAIYIDGNNKNEIFEFTSDNVNKSIFPVITKYGVNRMTLTEKDLNSDHSRILYHRILADGYEGFENLTVKDPIAMYNEKIEDWLKVNKITYTESVFLKELTKMAANKCLPHGKYCDQEITVSLTRDEFFKGIYKEN